MNDFDALPPHPWLAELAADPDRALADLLTGRIDKSPYARLSDAEFLLQVLRDDRPDERAALETALLAWLEARRREPWQRRARYGLPVYVAAVLEALNAIQMLELKRAAHHLDELHNTYLRWLEPLRLGNAADPALELWRCHALLPGDSAHHLADWLRFGVDAGQTHPATYLTVALQGLRDLPTGNDANANLRYALYALAQRYLARRGSDSNAANELRQYHASVRLAYPRAPQTWREVWEDALSGLKKDQADTVRAEIEGGKAAPVKGGKAGAPLGKTPKAAPRLDPGRFPEESRALAADLKTSKPVETLWPRIEKLFNDTLAYCRESGDSYDFVRSLCNVGDAAMKRSRAAENTAQALLVWLPDALEWEPGNPHVWMLWAHCLDSLGQFERAEWVYWEMRRYFPDNEHCRTELARLLLRQERDDEALNLLREAAERFPDREASRVELARLLLRRGEDGEAERWLREVVERHPDDEPSRVELARLLLRRGEDGEAERWLREVVKRHPDNEPSRVELARLLLRRGEDGEAERWLREAVERNPDREPSRVELARLLMARGAAFYPEARCRLDEVNERHPHHEQSRLELARLLDLQGDKPAAIAVLEAWEDSHPGSKYVHTALRTLRAGQDMGVPRWDALTDEAPAAPQKKTAATLPIPPAAEPGEQLVAAARTARAAFRMAHDEAAGGEELQARLTADPDDQLAAFFLAWRGATPDLPELPQAWGRHLADAWRAPREADWAGLAQTFPHRRRLTWALRWLAGLRDGAPLADADWQRLEKFAATPESRPAPGEALVARWVNTAGRDGAGLPGKPEALAEALVALTFYRDLSPVASFH